MDESAVCSAEVGFANQMRATHTVPSCVLAPHESHYESTVLASVLGSFGFRHGAFTPPARPLLTPAAAQERMADAPSGVTTHSHFGSFNFFAVAMANGVAQRSKAGWRARR